MGGGKHSGLGRVLIIDQCSLAPLIEPAVASFGELPRRMHMSGSKVFRPTDSQESNSSGYPAPFRDAQRKRWGVPLFAAFPDSGSLGTMVGPSERPLQP